MPRWALLSVAWVAAFSLRPGVTALSPVLPLLTAALRLTHAQGQFVFALPLILMGALGIPAGLLADRIGSRVAVALGLVMVAAGESLRWQAGGFASLVLFTVVFGVGMGIVQPALPKLIKERFLDRPTEATGIYSMGIVTGAAIGAWVTVPWLVGLTGGWRGPFLVWGGVGALALAAWLLVWPRQHVRPPRSSGVRLLTAWRTPGVGRVAALYCSQSMAFYTLTSWMPTYLHELGWSLARVQLPFGVFELVAIPSTVLAPWLMERYARRRPVALGAALTFLAGVLGMIFLPTRLTLLWAVLAGASNTVPLVLAMALPLEVVGPDQVASVTGFVLTVAYAGALVGPPVAGLLRDATGLPVAGLWPALAGAVALVAMSLLVPERPQAPAALAAEGAGA